MRKILALLLLAAACGGNGDAAADGSGGAAPDPSDPFACPITIPGKGFPAPGAHPLPASSDNVWFGTPELYVPLPVDGAYQPRKSVWWSVNFPGGGVEPQPEITVTFTRLDVKAEPITTGGPGTNANTAEDGWFMIAGIDPDDPGCWEVVARYKGAELSYVYER